MSLWNLLFTVLDAARSSRASRGGTWAPTRDATATRARPSRPAQPRQRTSSSSASSSTDASPGDIFSGTVDYVDEARKFVKVRAGDLTAVVFLAEISDRRIESPGQAVAAGDRVEFVLLRADPRGWVASIAAVDEARTREALAGLQKGDMAEGVVSELKDREAVLACDGFRMRVPLAEIDWRWLDHPSQALSLGEKARACVTRVHAPDDWLQNKRARGAHAVGSIRACRGEPASPAVPAAFAAVPFRLWAVPRIPRRCDAVVLYVLETLADEVPMQEIAAATGLPDAALQAVAGILADEGLARDGEPTAAGRRLVAAIARAAQFNEAPLRGLYASAAPAALQLQPPDAAARGDDYPRGWPRPAHDEGRARQFLQAADEAMPEWLLDRMAGDEAGRERLAALRSDAAVRVFLRRDGDLPWRPVRLDVPEHWLLAGLWAGFEPAGKPPFRPHREQEGCSHFLMLRMAAPDGAQEPAYLEPHTRTLWRPRSGRAHIRPGKPWVATEESPQPVGMNDLPTGPDTDQPRAPASQAMQADAWCSVRIATPTPGAAP